MRNSNQQNNKINEWLVAVMSTMLGWQAAICSGERRGVESMHVLAKRTRDLAMKGTLVVSREGISGVVSMKLMWCRRRGLMVWCQRRESGE